MSHKLSDGSSKKVCDDLLPKVSRSFALAIEALPEPLRSYVCTSYLLCRIVDTIEDHPSLPGKDNYFDAFDRLLLEKVSYEGKNFALLQQSHPPQSWDQELMVQCHEVFHFFASFPSAVKDAMKASILEMSQGMRIYATRALHGAIELETTEDLDRYCYYVAGTVGNLLTDLFALEIGLENSSWISAQKIRGYHFALGLQKVNMIKDVVQDLKRGSIFVPSQWMKTWNISKADLLQGQDNPRIQALLRFFIRQACDHLELARDYILNLPANPVGMRLFCIWPYVMALDTLILATKQSGLFTESHEIKVSRQKMFHMMKITKTLAPYETVLKFYFNQKISTLREVAAS